MSEELERCTKCTLPITWETLYFDEDGVCNLCKSWDIKADIDWEQRDRDLIDIFNKVKERQKDKPYDCIVPMSFGKDSTYTAYLAVRKYGLRVLAVVFDHLFFRPTILKNRKKVLDQLGIDCHIFKPNPKIVKKTMVESLKRRGDFCWHCHNGIFAYPMQVAIEKQIPLIIWGEGSGEYDEYYKFSEIEQTDEWKFNRRFIMGIRAEDMAGFINEPLSRLSPYLYPKKEDLDELGVISIPLGKFIPWNQEENAKLIHKELGWEYDYVESMYPNEKTFEKIECKWTGIRDYVKYLKRNFSRITHRTTIDIKQGRITRKQGMELIHKYENRKPHSLTKFLEMMELTEEEFNEICFKHIIPPAKRLDPNTFPIGEKLLDEDEWIIGEND